MKFALRQLPVSLLALALAACSATGTSSEALPDPNLIDAPTPVAGGKFASPYMSSGALAPWAESALQAGAAEDVEGYLSWDKSNAIDSAFGIAGKTFGDQPLVNEDTIASAGGWDRILNSSDVAFNNAEDLSVFLYASNSTDPQFWRALKITFDVYPDARSKFDDSVRAAAASAQKNAPEAISTTADAAQQQANDAVQAKLDEEQADADAKLEELYDENVGAPDDQ